MREEILNTKNQAIAQISDAKDAHELERLRIDNLGRNGRITNFIKRLKSFRPDEKKQLGILINETKNTIIKSLAYQQNKLKDSVRDWFDSTVPGQKSKTGHLHLITQEINEITSVFEKIGFVRVRYPEVEWDWFGQVREMFRVKTPPIRMINIAKCYRRQSDVSHYPMFHQFEGLVIDEGINITHLKGTLDYFAKSVFGSSVKTRIRPYHFQFTEPSFEVDFSCALCGGKGCKLCKAGWLEVGGSGMVHPNVLRAGNIDPKKYSGFAFGWGVERILMMKPGLNIPDLRQLYSTELAYLKQF